MKTAAALVLATASLISGCGGSDEPDEGVLPQPVVVASFYPLAWAAGQLTPPQYTPPQLEGPSAGKLETRVENLTPPGVEPHDLELSPSDIELIREASFVVYVGGGFQPAVEDAVDGRARRSFDILEGDDYSDPHAWLDPARFASIVSELGSALRRTGPAHDLQLELLALDREFAVGLRECDRRVFVTTHAAFGRLAARYGLTQISLAGASPEAEPSPRELEELIDRVRDSGATTVFSEPLVSDEVAETVAREAGVAVATLDPIEGLSQDQLDAGEDYLSVMRSNLAALRKALGCR